MIESLESRVFCSASARLLAKLPPEIRSYYALNYDELVGVSIRRGTVTVISYLTTQDSPLRLFIGERDRWSEVPIVDSVTGPYPVRWQIVSRGLVVL